MKDFSIQQTKLCCLWALLTWTLSVVSELTAQEPELIAEVDATQVYEGEPFTYKVTLNHVDNPARPELENFLDFIVQSAGEVDLNSQQVTIINGVSSVVTRRGRQFHYRLTPRKTGELTIPAPQATIDGKTLVGKPITIRVTAAGAQDIVRLHLKVDRAKVYPTQPFTVSLTVAVKGLPSPATENDPLSVQPEPPLLTIDWLDDDRLPKSLVPKLPWQDVVQKLISRRGHGFRINSIRNSSAFSIFDDSSLAFHPRPQVVKQPDADGIEVDYWIYEFERTFTAKSPGKLDFSSASVRGNFATKVSRNRLLGEAVFSRSNPVSVEVSDVPEQGRPECYVGAIGKFSLVTELSPTEARVGDPMTFTLTLTGSGSLEDASPPDIMRVPEIQAGFKTYDGTSQTDGNSKRFTYSLRPLKANITELPSIPVAYFDVEKEEYVTLHTQPIALNLTAGQQLAAVDVMASNSNSGDATDAGVLKMADTGLFANYSLESLRDDAIDPKLWLIAWASLVGSVVLLNLVGGCYQRRNADPRMLRRRGALARAQALIAQARTLDSTGRNVEGLDHLRRAVTGLISDLLDLPAPGMTVGEVRQQLDHRTVDSSVRERVLKFLEQCDAAKFGATTVSLGEIIPQSSMLIQQLHEQLSRSRKQLSKIGALALLITVPFALGCSSKTNEQTMRHFLEAQQSFESAQSPEEFQMSALRYQQIIDSGVRSGAVFFNQGNAWAKANQPGRAIAAYRQALRYLPRDTYVQANLKATLASIQNLKVEQQPGSSVLQYIYFWKNWLNLRELFWMETCLLLLLLATACCGWLFGKCRNMAVFLTVPTFILGLTCFSQWRDQQEGMHGVVCSGPVRALKGDGENYQPAFTGELPTGTEFQVVEQRREWVQIDIDGVGRGWVKDSQVVVY